MSQAYFKVSKFISHLKGQPRQPGCRAWEMGARGMGTKDKAGTFLLGALYSLPKLFLASCFFI